MPRTVSKKLFTLEFPDTPSRGEAPGGLDGWRIGEAFAFSDTEVLFLGGSPRTELEPRRPGPGVVAPPNTPPLSGPVIASKRELHFPKLASVFTDKELYREGKDTVRIVSFVPSRARTTVKASLALFGSPLADLDVSLDDMGIGVFEFPEPPAGEYEVRLLASSARFTVAEYKLAPLTARFDGITLGAKDLLEFSAILETYGVPFVGDVSVRLMDGAHWPARELQKIQLSAGASDQGRISGRLTLVGQGPFSLDVVAKADAAKTATLPVPGSRASERAPLELDTWGRKSNARLMPFEGSHELRGFFVASEPNPESIAPLSVPSVDRDRITIRLDVRASAYRIVAIDLETQAVSETFGARTEPGATVELAHGGAATLVLAGVSYLGHAFEGRAVFLRPTAPALDLKDFEASEPLSLDAPAKAEPGATVTLRARGPEGASAFVLVKDERLQVTDTPVSATAASLRRQVEVGLGVLSDHEVRTTLAELSPRPPPPPVFAAMGGAFPEMAMPAMAVSRSSGVVRDKSARPPPAPAAAPEALSKGADEKPESAPRTDFPEVVLARVVKFDANGRFEESFKLGQAMGSMKIEVFCVSGLDWHFADRTLLVTKPVFGELVLPKFVAAGDFAEGRLYVNVAEGVAKVTVARDGSPVSLLSGESEGPIIELSAPGATVSFAAKRGEYVAKVESGASSDQSRGRVDEPGKLVWLQKAIRMLQVGELLERTGPTDLALQVLPSLDEVFEGMVGGLRGYEHACCEQTSAVLLAAAAAYLTSKTEDDKRKASNHIRACVAREKSMHLPGRGFKGWPNYPDEVFVYSPGATLNLLQVEMLQAHSLDPELGKAVAECLDMARDAARAHRIETAPAAPKSAREAYGRFSKFVEDRQRMAEFIRERVEPWEKEMKAILKFELPGFSTETYHRTPAMIRAETAFGAAALIESGGDLQARGLELANTVLGAIRENGSMYSTLDSVAAMTLLTALGKARITAGPTSRVELDGRETKLADAVKLENVRSVKPLDAPVQVQLTRLVEEDYTAIDKGVTARAYLQKSGRPAPSRVAPGDSVSLVVELDSGYVAGDLLHVFLPDALSWVMGGGQVKKFSLDLKGEKRIEVPLAVTGVTLNAQHEVAPQHFAACIRNMYDEERGKGFGELSVTVDPAAQPEEGLAHRVMRGLRSILGS
ncbi:MAG: hypothetical protein HY791_06970 [Deltaproteobacteria bacterium]|nr:hypothetical protein [Deltaproteobacteria bacterium]